MFRFLVGVFLGVSVLTITACGQTDSVDGDRAALVALYNATDGDNWKENYNWLSDKPVGEWFGVGMNAQGRVDSLNLWGNQLSGPIPAELGNLSNLEYLVLQSNQLSGPIPSELGNLSRLEGLILNGNQLSGPIPPALGNLSNLKGLLLLGNQLSGPIPPSIGKLTKLEVLFLQKNNLSGPIPPALGNLSNLKGLMLFDNPDLCMPSSLKDWKFYSSGPSCP